jgi:hypothetical protein
MVGAARRAVRPVHWTMRRAERYRPTKSRISYLRGPPLWARCWGRPGSRNRCRSRCCCCNRCRRCIGCRGRCCRGCGTLCSRAVFPAGVENIGAIPSTPDDHFTARPHCRVARPGTGRVARAGGCPRIIDASGAIRHCRKRIASTRRCHAIQSLVFRVGAPGPARHFSSPWDLSLCRWKFVTKRSESIGRADTRR